MKVLLLLTSLLGIATAQLIVGDTVLNLANTAEATRSVETDTQEVTLEPSNSQEKVPDVIPEPRDGAGAPEFPVVIQPRAADSTWNRYTLTSDRPEVSWTSQNYPNNYGSNQNVKWIIYSDAGTTISLTCSEFNTYCDGVDQLSLYPGGEDNIDNGQFYNACGYGIVALNSTVNSFAVNFVSGSRSRPASSTAYKFSCVFKVISSAATTTSAPQTTTTTKAPSTTASTTTAAPTTKPPSTAAPTTKPSTAAPTTQPPTTVAPATTAAAPSSCTCGVRKEQARIVGGTQTGPSEFPWRCGLQNITIGATSVSISNVFCGSSLISPNYILTASHCCKGLDVNKLYATCGLDSTNPNDRYNARMKVSKIIMHPNYDSNTQDNDICLLKLEKPVTYTSKISPVCLPFKNQGNNCNEKPTVTADGWGVLSEDGEQPTMMQKVDLPCINSTECSTYYKRVGINITDNMLCTYLPPKDTCQGDSGGSIDYKSIDKYYCLGVVSFGVGCAKEGFPGVYAKTSNYLPWIKATTGDTFCGA